MDFTFPLSQVHKIDAQSNLKSPHFSPKNDKKSTSKTPPNNPNLCHFEYDQIQFKNLIPLQKCPILAFKTNGESSADAHHLEPILRTQDVFFSGKFTKKLISGQIGNLFKALKEKLINWLLSWFVFSAILVDFLNDENNRRFQKRK